MASESEKSFHLSEQDGKEQQVQEPLLNTDRKGSLKKQKSSGSKRREDEYRSPRQPVNYMSECQVSLNKFMDRFKTMADAPANQRKVDKHEVSSEEEEETPEGTKVEDEDHKAFRSSKAPYDASDCQSVQTLKEFLDHHRNEV